jgi:hypothetical protein
MILDSVNIFFSVLLIVIYINSTYNLSLWYNYDWNVISLVIHFYLIIEWMIKLYSVKSLT